MASSYMEFYFLDAFLFSKQRHVKNQWLDADLRRVVTEIKCSVKFTSLCRYKVTPVILMSFASSLERHWKL